MGSFGEGSGGGEGVLDGGVESAASDYGWDLLARCVSG